MGTALDTLTPQLIHSIANTLALLVIFGYGAFKLASLKKAVQTPPQEGLVHELRAEVERFSGYVADLEERFSRFQKREGMRHARSAKEESRDLVAEAAAIKADAGTNGAQTGTPAAKTELYRRARGLSS